MYCKVCGKIIEEDKCSMCSLCCTTLRQQLEAMREALQGCIDRFANHYRCGGRHTGCLECEAIDAAVAALAKPQKEAAKQECKTCDHDFPDCPSCYRELNGNLTGWKAKPQKEAGSAQVRVHVQCSTVDYPCTHESTTWIDWPDGGSVEFCNDCCMSRHHWEQGDSGWQNHGHKSVDDCRREGARLADEMAEPQKEARHD